MESSIQCHCQCLSSVVPVCLHKVHARTSARRATSRWTSASLPTSHPLEGILEQSLPHTAFYSSMSLWPAPGAAPCCLSPQGSPESHLLHWCSADCQQNREREQHVYTGPQHAWGGTWKASLWATEMELWSCCCHLLLVVRPCGPGCQRH